MCHVYAAVKFIYPLLLCLCRVVLSQNDSTFMFYDHFKEILCSENIVLIFVIVCRPNLNPELCV